MKNLETSKSKIQNICDIIKEEAIVPAHQQASEIVENAKIQAEQIIQEAEAKAKELSEKKQKELDALNKQVTASLRLAGREALATLKEKIEKKLFSPTLQALVSQESSNESMVAKLLDSLSKAVVKEGIDGDLIAYLGKEVSKEQVCKYLATQSLQKLKAEEMQLGDFPGGVKLSIPRDKITLDMSDEAIFELFARFLQRDFQRLVFGEEILG